MHTCYARHAGLALLLVGIVVSTSAFKPAGGASQNDTEAQNQGPQTQSDDASGKPRLPDAPATADVYQPSPEQRALTDQIDRYQSQERLLDAQIRVLQKRQQLLRAQKGIDDMQSQGTEGPRVAASSTQDGGAEADTSSRATAARSADHIDPNKWHVDEISGGRGQWSATISGPGGTYPVQTHTELPGGYRITAINANGVGLADDTTRVWLPLAWTGPVGGLDEGRDSGAISSRAILRALANRQSGGNAGQPDNNASSPRSNKAAPASNGTQAE